MKEKKPTTVEESTNEATLLCTIMFKPAIAYYVCIAFGVLLIIIWFWMTIILGVALIGIAVFSLFYLKDRKVFEIFNQYINVYDQEGKTFVTTKLEEIDQWACEKDSSGFDCVKIALNNQETIIRNTYFIGKVRRAFRKIMPEKEVGVKNK